MHSEQQVVYTDPNEAAHGTLEVVEGIASKSQEQLNKLLLN